MSRQHVSSDAAAHNCLQTMRCVGASTILQRIQMRTAHDVANCKKTTDKRHGQYPNCTITHPASHCQAAQCAENGPNNGIAAKEGPLRVTLHTFGLELIHAVSKGTCQGEGLVCAEQHPAHRDRYQGVGHVNIMVCYNNGTLYLSPVHGQASRSSARWLTRRRNTAP